MEVLLNACWNWISWPPPLTVMGTDLFAPLIFSQCIISPSRKTLAGGSFLSRFFCEVKASERCNWESGGSHLLRSGGHHQQCHCELEVWILGTLSPGSARSKTSAVVCAAGVVAKPGLLQCTWEPLELSHVFHLYIYSILLCFPEGLKAWY